MTRILVIDASAPVGGVGFYSEACSMFRDLPGQRRHAEAIVPLLVEIMDEAGCGWSELDGIGVSTGPGSFTGIRVGLAAAQGLAAAHDTALVGIGSLDILARACYDGCRPEVHEQIFAMQDVRRDEVAVQGFRVLPGGLDRVSEMTILKVSDPQFMSLLGSTSTKPWVSGDGGRLVSETQSLNLFEPSGSDRARALAVLTLDAVQEGRLEPAVPVYARPANAKPRKPVL